MVYLQGQKPLKLVRLAFVIIEATALRQKTPILRIFFSKLGLISHPGKKLPSPILVTVWGNGKEMHLFVLFNQNIFLNT